MHGIGSNMFQGIEQTEDSLYSSKENDESDIESGKLITKFISLHFVWVSAFLIIKIWRVGGN